MPINLRHSALVLLIVSLTPAAALGQGERYRWQGFWLHPEGGSRSVTNAVDGDIPSGEARVGITDAAIWPDWTGEYVNLRPDGAISAGVEGADGGFQGGQVSVSYFEGFPALWQGSTESVENMAPEGPYWSGRLFARRGVQTVGRVASTITGASHAGLWLNNDPDQFIDLHFASADWSEAYATDGTWQGGRAAFPGVGIRAMLWKGNPSTNIIMGPGEYLNSNIQGMAPGTQVGYYINISYHAVLWHDTPESWLDMNPTDANTASLFATTGDLHVGYASTPATGFIAHAGVWYGDDPDSFFDLHPFVPDEYADDSSIAYDIDIVDGVIYIGGAINTPRQHAFFWVGVPIDSTDQDNQGPKTPDTATRIGKP